MTYQLVWNYTRKSFCACDIFILEEYPSNIRSQWIFCWLIEYYSFTCRNGGNSVIIHINSNNPYYPHPQCIPPNRNKLYKRWTYSGRNVPLNHDLESVSSRRDKRHREATVIVHGSRPVDLDRKKIYTTNQPVVPSGCTTRNGWKE